MNTVEFDKESSYFILNRGGVETPYQYLPNSNNLWEGLKDEDFTLVLLNCPFLHKESDWFEVRLDGSDDRAGYMFPISMLESEEAEGKQLLSYLFVAYRILLTILPDEKEATGLLSESYTDAYILMVHKKTMPGFDIKDYLISMANFGFYPYRGQLKGKYPELKRFEQMPNTLRLEKRVVDNFNNGYVVDLLNNRLCGASDFITRFVLVYQVVELYISEIHRKLLDDAIKNYQSGVLNKNDFGEELKNISRESSQIEQLFDGFLEEKACLEYKQASLSLFNDVAYKYRNEKIPTLFYALRNQVFHNYGLFRQHEDALFEVIFCFERVVMMLLSKREI